MSLGICLCGSVRRVILSALALACMVSSPGWGQPAASGNVYRISGVVVNSVNGQRLSRVRMVAAPADHSGKEVATVSGLDGRFALEGLPAGTWWLYAERKGFARQGYGERPGAANSLSGVATGPQGMSEGLNFRWTPPAAISGKVTDENGAPVRASLQVIMALDTGRKQYQRIKDVTSDELGEYHIPDLPAAPCYLLAVASPPRSRGLSDPPPAFAPLYYPDAPDARAAAPIDLKPGEEYKADFLLHHAQGAAVNIKGKIVAAAITLNGEGPGGAEVVLGQLDPTESRSFLNVAPGHYKLTLTDKGGAQSSKRIEVGAGDLTVTVPFANSAAVNATVHLADGDPAQMASATVLLHADGDEQTFTHAVGSGGMTISGMPSGRYKLMLGAGALYIKSVTSANARIVDGMVDVPESGEVKLDVVVAGDGGKVSGRVRTNGKPACPVRVVLAPRADSTNSADYHSYQTDTDGSFRFAAVKPGDYILFVTRDWKLEFGNPDAARKYLAAGRLVRVLPKSSIDTVIELAR